MYTLSRAFVQQNRQWETVDVSQLSFKTLFQDYKHVLFIIVAAGEEKALLLNDMDKTLRYSNTLVADYFSNITSTLPWLPDVPYQRLLCGCV